MSSVLAAQPPIACNIPVDADCFDASSFITSLPARGEQSVLASFQLHPQYCGVLTHFAQFTDDFAAHPANIRTPGLEWLLLQNGKPVFPYLRLEMIINPWGQNCLPVLIRLDENAKLEFVIRNVNYSENKINLIAGRIIGRYWYNRSFGGR
jgi:hypothetical protein